MKEIDIQRVLHILNNVIEKYCFTKEQFDDDLTKYGMNSIEFIRVIVALEDEFKIEFPDDYLIFERLNSINKIIQALKTF